MRKSAAVLIVLFLLTFVFTGCGIDKETVQSDFSVMVSGTTTPENIRSTAEYMDDNIKKVGKDIAAQMQITSIATFQKIRTNCNWNYFTDIMIKKKRPSMKRR